MIDAKRLDQIKRRAAQGDPVVGVGDTITNGELLELVKQVEQLEPAISPQLIECGKALALEIVAATKATIRVAIAFGMISKALSLEEMEAIVNRALKGEFDNCAG